MTDFDPRRRDHGAPPVRVRARPTVDSPARRDAMPASTPPQRVVGALDAALAGATPSRIRRATIAASPTRASIGIERPSATPPRGHPVIRRSPVAQIAMSEAVDVPTITSMRVSGRPERTFGGSMGDHSTAWTVHVTAVLSALKGQTLADAFGRMAPLVDALRTLPGFQARGRLTGRQRDLHQAAIDALNAVCARVQRPPPDTERQLALLQEYVVAYLDARETVPYSTINAGEVSKATSGKTKGERGGRLLQLADGGGTPAENRDVIGSMFDRRAVALVGAAWHRQTATRIAPGLDPALGAEARVRLYVTQHVQSMRTAFPRLFEQPRADAGGDGMDTGPVIGDGADIVEHLVAATAPEVVVSLRADLDLLERFRARAAQTWFAASQELATLQRTGRDDRDDAEIAADDKDLKKKRTFVASLVTRFAGTTTDIATLRTHSGLGPEAPVALPVLPAQPLGGRGMRERHAPRARLDPSHVAVRKRKRGNDADAPAAKKARVEPVATDVVAAAPLAPADDLDAQVAAMTGALDATADLVAPEEDEEVETEGWTGDGTAHDAPTTTDLPDQAVVPVNTPSHFGSLTVQIVLLPDASVAEVRIEGRPRPQHDGSHGAHVTAWVVHADRVRNGLRGVPGAEIGRRLLVMEQEAEASYERLTGQRPDPGLRAAPPASAGLSGLQTRIAQHLVYVDAIPGSSLAAAKPDGRREGAHRGTLMAFHIARLRAAAGLRAGPVPVRAALFAAICGLLDLKEALLPVPVYSPTGTHLHDDEPDAGQIDAYVRNHLKAIEAAYPGVVAAAGATFELVYATVTRGRV